MAASIKFFKVNSLPGSLEANSLYFVNNGEDYAETWVTDNSGNAKQVGNTTMIENLLTEIDGGTFV